MFTTNVNAPQTITKVQINNSMIASLLLLKNILLSFLFYRFLSFLYELCQSFLTLCQREIYICYTRFIIGYYVNFYIFLP